MLTTKVSFRDSLLNMKNQQKYKQLRKASNDSNVENKQKRRGKKQDLGEYTVHITENKFKKRREKTSNHYLLRYKRRYCIHKTESEHLKKEQLGTRKHSWELKM